METSKKYFIANILISIVFVGLVIALYVSCIVFMNQTNKRVDKGYLRNYIVEQADKDWFDYCYEIVENYDENGNIRYRLTYYYSKVNESGVIEYLITETKDGYAKEKI